MKKIIISFLFCGLLAMSLASQNVRSVYFLNDWSQRCSLNASFETENGFLSFPLGNTEFGISSNTGLSNYIYPYNNELVTFLHPSVDGHAFLDKLQSDIYLNQNLNVNILSVGYHTKNAFWTFDYRLKENLNINIPQDFFRLIKLGFEHSTNQFDLKKMSLEQSNISEFSLGYSRDINSKIRVGAKINLLCGISSERIKYNQFDILLSNDNYEINATGESVVMSDVLTFKTDANNNFNFADYNVNLTNQKPVGTGVSVNLGVTYQPIKNLTLSAAINDLGFLSWNAAGIKKGIASSNINFTGFSAVNLDSIDIEGQLNQLEQGVNNLILFKKQAQTTQNIFETIPCTINVSAEYSFFNSKEKDIRLGLLWNSYNSYTLHQNELMGALTVKPAQTITLSATYAFLRNDSNHFGFAFNYSPRWINVFFATDFLANQLSPQFLPIHQFDINFQAGISFYLGDDQ